MSPFYSASSFCSLLLLVALATVGSGFEITEHSVDVRVNEGDSLTLFCTTDDFFEYCSWSNKVIKLYLSLALFQFFT